MPNRDEVIKAIDFLSGTVSQRIWTVSVGVLVFCLTFIVESISVATEAFLKPVQVVGPIVFALLSLLADLIQYIAGYLLNREMLQTMEQRNLIALAYNHDALSFKVRMWSFRTKIGFCLVSSVWLILVMGGRLLDLL